MTFVMMPDAFDNSPVAIVERIMWFMAKAQSQYCRSTVAMINLLTRKKQHDLKFKLRQNNIPIVGEKKEHSMTHKSHLLAWKLSKISD